MPAILVGSFMMNLVFVMKTPEHRCKLPMLDNDTYEITSEYQRHLVNITIPESDDKTIDYDRCHYYVYPFGESPSKQNATKITCTEWVYDKSVITKSFASEMHLVCQDTLLTSHAQMIFYFGVLVGDLLFGILADTFGRKKSLYLAIIILIGSAFGVCWSSSYITFVILEFIIGAANHGAFMICCVLGLEMVGPSKRNWAGIVIHMFFAVGLVYLAGMGYFLRNWQHVGLAIAAPCVLFLCYWWIIPESPRWLLSMGRHEEAVTILKKVALTNKANIPEKLLQIQDEPDPHGNLWHLFSSKVLFVRTMIIFLNWAVVSLMYYGVTMNVGNMGGDFYLNFFLLALIEFPAYSICIYLVDKIGRKKLHCGCMLLGGFACASTIFTVSFGGKSLEPLTLALAIIGKLGASGAFCVIYVFSAELYPTVVRNAGMGASSCIARIGGMLAPYVAKSGELVDGKFGKALPLVIFGAASVFAGLMCLLLPETLNRRLPETIEDGNRFGRGNDYNDSTTIVEKYTSKKEKQLVSSESL
ncbi:MFS transporter, OCT family, solute carrier family 22 (organic cation transporter), member 4/5 [Mytilus galloprovincialis]|uniref:MFS transporter, OCT family, solute carrier family 22 (Organic cation transporter), member 4/5 n=1 Tax=Mytilus galloprovincialis TaxID=29158 RepID=A0A8B6E7S1_MYTGA|nr:MFS transporter, OCT family, solute carrier family 22 (organic cation transporter), member 4/5 [Mytilus galloprovincialis]